MENINFNKKEETLETKGISPEELIIGETYKIAAPYSRGEFEGQINEGEVEFIKETTFADGSPMYHFRYTKTPEHIAGSTYQTNSEGLQWIKKLN